MAETIVSNPRGAEISERTRELVLPDDEGTTLRAVASPRIAGPRYEEREFAVSESEIIATDPTRAPAAEAAPSASEPEAPSQPAPAFPGDRSNRGAQAASAPTPQTPSTSAPNQRPSFWRRIALGRRGQAREAQTSQPTTNATTKVPEVNTEPATGLAARAKSVVTARPTPKPVADTTMLETRIVEPMLQALVSVEAKLERSHGDLMGRSDQVEQRLTQLWDIEEQLGALGELQESLLQVSEQQRRLESAILGQTRTLRWLIGAVFFSLAAAAFVVAAIR